MIGGIVVNLIVGFLIYVMVLTVWGRDYVAYEDAGPGYMFGENMEAVGFLDGDKIKQIDGEELFSYDWKGIYNHMLVFLL